MMPLNSKIGKIKGEKGMMGCKVFKVGGIMIYNDGMSFTVLHRHCRISPLGR